MSNLYGPRIVTNGLVLCLDAGNNKSYPGSGSTWYDLSGNNYHFTLTNSPVFGKHRGADCFTFSGTNDYATRAGSISHDIGTQCTLIITMASINNAQFGNCARLFSINDGSTVNNDFTTFFTTASCDQDRFGLWYKSNPAGLYSISSLRTLNDDYKIICYKWMASSSAAVMVNGKQESSSFITTAFNYLAVNRMTIGMNSALNRENSSIRVASVLMYNRNLSLSEVLQNYNALKGRFGL